MVGVATAQHTEVSGAFIPSNRPGKWGADGQGGQADVREIGDGEKGVLVEDFAVKEPLQEVPRHWSFAGGRRLSASGCWFWLFVDG